MSEDDKHIKGEVDKVMSKIFDQYMERLERDNWEMYKSLRWAYKQLKYAEDDHDCKASPDSGCNWCYEMQEVACVLDRINKMSEENREREGGSNADK